MKARKMVSAVRSSLNAVNTDIFLSDRYILTMLISINNKILERHIHKSAVVKSPSLFQTITCLEMEPTEAYKCGLTKSKCEVSVSKCELPKIAENDYGMLIDYIGTIDGKKKFERLGSFMELDNILTIFPNRKLKPYYIIENNKVYLTDPFIETIKVTAMFSDITTDFESLASCSSETEQCPINPLDRAFPTIPKLEADVITTTINTILQTKYQTHQDETTDQRELT